MIPKIIHRIWMGSPRPPHLEAMTRRWQTHFPDYRLEWWTGERLTDLGMPVHWHTARTYAEKADIARYLVLHRFGGIYADCDVQPLRPFDYLWEDTDSLVAFQESPDLVWNGLIVASVGARALDLASRLADRSARRHPPAAAPNVRTGPFVFDGGRRLRTLHRPQGHTDLSTRVRARPGGAVRPVRWSPPRSGTHRSGPWPPTRRGSPSTTGGDTTVADAELSLRLLPVRVRRVMRSWTLRRSSPGAAG